MNLPSRPKTRRDLIIDDYHGTKVADPFRWLEDDAAQEVQQWMDEQNAGFEKYINSFDIRQTFKLRLAELWHYPRVSVPSYKEGYYYTWRNDGLQNQPVLHRSADLNELGEVVLDPNLLSKDGTVAVKSNEVSPKGNYFAYGLSTSGSGWQVIKVLNLNTKENLNDLILHVYNTHICWLPNESGFFYTRYPEPKGTNMLEAEIKNSMVYLHILGQEQSEDTLMHSSPEHPEWGFGFFTDEGKKWVFMENYCSSLFKNQLHYKPLAKLNSPWLPIADDFEEGYELIGLVDDLAYLYTQKDAAFGKVMSLRLSEKGVEDWQTVIPDQGEKIESVHLVNNHLLVCSLHHATHRLNLYNLDGSLNNEIKLPPMASVADISAVQNREEFFIQIDGYLYPPTVFRYDFSNKEPSVWFAPKIAFPFDDYESYQVFCSSKDGVKIPLFITHRKGMKTDGRNPTLLYGYGGLNISGTPWFSVQRLAWLEKGGIYVTTCLRGGGEYGEAWHRAGMLESKQNVFDDFISAGEYLIGEKYTTAERLGIMGFSNGGLLAGACLTQRPDLYAAVIIGRPDLDMLRYHLFTTGQYFTSEFGCADDPRQFKFLYEYSPLHNVKINTIYPPTLIMTADTDDCCVPGHARKFAATLQMADAGENPILIRIEKSAGHGTGMPMGKVINESADLYTFLYVNLFK